MQNIKPIKRNEFLAPLSREHHQALLLCWKIKTGFSKGIDVQRIKNYCDWFYQTHLIQHFELEEKFVFPILGNRHQHVQDALGQHHQLRELFNEFRSNWKNIYVLRREYFLMKFRILQLPSNWKTFRPFTRKKLFVKMSWMYFGNEIT